MNFGGKSLDTLAKAMCLKLYKKGVSRRTGRQANKLALVSALKIRAAFYSVWKGSLSDRLRKREKIGKFGAGNAFHSLFIERARTGGTYNDFLISKLKNEKARKNIVFPWSMSILYFQSVFLLDKKNEGVERIRINSELDLNLK